METDVVSLAEYVNGQVHPGILIGFNQAFVISGIKRAELIALDSKSAEIIKPLVTGADIRKWHIQHNDKWLIFTRRGIDINRYPAIKKHLEQWREDLTKLQSRSSVTTSITD